MTSRPLTPAEHAWAVELFGPTLPRRERIRVSPRVGLGRRPFTFPGPRGTTVFLGRDHADPVRSNPELLAHELAHVWQLAHARNRLWWLAGAAVVQVQYLLGRDVYDPGDGDGVWASYGIEAQATLLGRAAVRPTGTGLRRHLAAVRGAGPPRRRRDR